MYLRQSKDNPLAIERQRQDLTNLCTSRGWSWTEYEDNDYSASVKMPGSRITKKKRPRFQLLLADVEAGKIGAIVSWDADRLYRHPRELEDIIDLADTKDLELATIGGAFDLGTPTGRANARMKGVFARMEVEQKAERQKRAARQRAEMGKHWWPTRPFGFEYTEGTPKLDEDGNQVLNSNGHRTWEVPPRPVLDKDKNPVLDAEEAKLISAAYEAILAGGSLRSISNQWNADGVLTPKGNRWTGAQVGQLLINPRNCGMRAYGLRPAEGVRAIQDLDLHEANWPAIVTRDVWEGTCAVLANPDRRSGPGTARKYLLSNIAICGNCEARMSSGMTNAKSPLYRCNHCQRVSRSLKMVDDMAIEAVVARLSRPDAAELTVDRTRPDLAELQATASALHAQIKQAETDYNDDIITARDLKAKRDKVNEKLEKVNARLLDAHKAHIFDGVIGAPDVRKAFLRLGLERKRNIVSALITITVNPTGKGAKLIKNDVAIVFR